MPPFKAFMTFLEECKRACVSSSTRLRQSTRVKHSYYLGELVLPKQQSIKPSAPQFKQPDDDLDLDDTAFDSVDFMDVFDNLDDLVVDEDFEAFVSFINGTD